MDNQSTVKERLNLYLKYLGIGQAAFEKQCGLSNGYVNNIKVSISPKKMHDINKIYPELNAGWLLTGEGRMLHTEQSSILEPDSKVSEIVNDNNMSSENARLNNRVDELLAQNRLLIETLHTQMEMLKKTTAQKGEDAECAAVS